GTIDYTLVDSAEFTLGRNFHPQIRVGFDLMDGESLAWALNARDGAWLKRVSEFFTRIGHDGRLEDILERYYGHSERSEFVGPRDLVQDVQLRLPRYRQWFEESAAHIGEDWRVLAAISYQESHWDAAAVSPTGVRGLMMLTEQTAEQLGVANRDDPRQSIEG